MTQVCQFYAGDGRASSVGNSWIGSPGRGLLAGFLFLLVGIRGPAAEHPMGLSVGAQGELLRNGARYQAIGVNYYDLFQRQLLDATNTTAETGLRILAGYQVPFVRFSAGGYWPHDWALYLTNRAQYFARLDWLVERAERIGIGLIPSLFWNYSTIPDLVGEPVSRWGDTRSRTHQFMRDYVREVVRRYRNSSAIWAWEFGNEYNLPADLPNAASHRAPVAVSLGTPATRSAADDLTHEMFRLALAAFANEVRRHDSHRLILSGNAFPRVSAWHQAAEKSWKRDTPEQFALMIAADNPSPIDSLSVRAYDLTNDVGRLPLAMRASHELKKPLIVGEFGVSGEGTSEARQSFTLILRAMETNRVPLAALWVFDFEGQARDWSVTPDNGRGWQLDEIRSANQRLSKLTPN